MMAIHEYNLLSLLNYKSSVSQDCNSLHFKTLEFVTTPPANALGVQRGQNKILTTLSFLYSLTSLSHTLITFPSFQNFFFIQHTHSKSLV